ncbi:MAG: DUF2160 family membrane protein [Candidatus Hydrothermarchaeaceae archaeon]
MLQNVSSVVRGAISIGIGVAAMVSILAIFVGETTPRRGFLPWTTTWGDRFFVSLLTFFLISLLWLKFIEPFLPIYGALILGIIIGIIVVKYG